MTLPHLPADRPIPDKDDLRLLAELINNAYIPLANAAWQARMSQAEAAIRLVSMAERGLPLRLVADGDRQALWHIAQAGPATGGVPVTGTPAAPASADRPVGTQPPGPQPSGPQPSGPQPSGPDPMPGATGQPSGPGPIPGATGQPGAPGGSGPVVLPPPAPVPPHEQAIAGAVPLGEPPFGQAQGLAAGEPARSGADLAPAGGETAQPGEPAQPGEAARSGGESAPGNAATSDAVPPSPPGEVPAEGGSAWGPAGSASWARSDEPAAAPASGSQAASGPRWQALPVSGPSGEQLTVTILDVVDPGDQVLTDAGFRMEPGKRAVLVHSSVQNTGQAHYYPVGDLYLVLETAGRELLGRASVAVASHPAFPVGVAPGRTADGWSVFLIPSDTVLGGLKWCIRPDMPQTILSWPIAP